MPVCVLGHDPRPGRAALELRWRAVASGRLRRPCQAGRSRSFVRQSVSAATVAGVPARARTSSLTGPIQVVNTNNGINSAKRGDVLIGLSLDAIEFCTSAVCICCQTKHRVWRCQDGKRPSTVRRLNVLIDRQHARSTTPTTSGAVRDAWSAYTADGISSAASWGQTYSAQLSNFTPDNSVRTSLSHKNQPICSDDGHWFACFDGLRARAQTSSTSRRPARN